MAPATSESLVVAARVVPPRVRALGSDWVPLETERRVRCNLGRTGVIDIVPRLGVMTSRHKRLGVARGVDQS